MIIASRYMKISPSTYQSHGLEEESNMSMATKRDQQQQGPSLRQHGRRVHEGPKQQSQGAGQTDQHEVRKGLRNLLCKLDPVIR